MKKRLLSVLLIICLCAALLPTFAAADGKPWDTDPSGWTALTNSYAGETLAAGNYYLTGNIEVLTGYALTISDSATVMLDLNGYTVKCTETNTNDAGGIKVGQSGNLTIQDSGDGGKVIGSKGIALGKGSTLTLNSGTIERISNGYGAIASVVTFGSSELDNLSQNDNCTVHLEGGVVDGGSYPAICLDGTSKTKHTIYADGGKVYGMVEASYGDCQYTNIYHTEGADTTEFYGQVRPGCDISGGIFYGNVVTRGTISGGTFYGTVTCWVKNPGEYTKVNNTNNNIVNNGVFCFREYSSYSVNNQYSQSYFESLKLDGYGYIQWYRHNETDSAYEDIYYTNDGKNKIDINGKVTVTFDLNGGSFGDDADLFPDYKTGYYVKGSGNIGTDADGNVTVKVIKGLPMPAPAVTPTKDGAEKFNGWYTDARCTVPFTGFDGKTPISNYTDDTGNITLYAWPYPAPTPLEIYAAYRVEHYLQQDDGSYELQAEDTQFPLYGLVGETAEAEPNEYSGYCLNAEKSTSGGKIIKPTGENPEVLTLKLYYDKEFNLGALIAILDDIGFRDVAKSDWFYSDVMSLAEAGVVAGYPDGTFRPNGEVTWGETLKLVAGALGAGDMPSDGSHWASGYLQWAKRNGFVSANASINLDAAMTRGEVADLLAKAMQLTADASAANPFEDAAPASALALYAAGIIAGSLDDGRLLFRAKSTITRAEMATVIWRIYRSGYGASVG